MIALLLLGSMLLWIIITIVAMFIGSMFGRTFATKLLGAFMGFMLTMGGFFVYWTIEHYQVKNYVTNFCETEAGIKEYVTPEEFKERLKSNNWENVPKYTVIAKGDEKIDEYILFEGKEFKSVTRDTSTSKIKIYRHSADKKNNYPTVYTEYIYVFNRVKVVITKHTALTITSAGIANALFELKFWISDIEDCRINIKNDNFNLYIKELNNEK